MGQGGMMGGPFVMRIIFTLMDSDGDGTISLQEFQAAHEKSSRQWMPTKMACSLWRRCTPSCTEPGDGSAAVGPEHDLKSLGYQEPTQFVCVAKREKGAIGHSRAGS